MSVPDGAAGFGGGGAGPDGGGSGGGGAGSGGGGADSGGAAGALGPDGGPPDGGGGAEVGGGGTGGSSDARDAEATPPDTMTSDAGPCSSGLPEMGKLIIARCGANTAPKGGAAFPDGTYQLFDVEVIGACSIPNTPPPLSRTFTVSGSKILGLDGIPGANGMIWSHWRATLSFNGDRVVYMFECGDKQLGSDYTTAGDEIVLFVPMNNARQAFHYKRL